METAKPQDPAAESESRYWALIERAVPKEGAGTEEHAEAVADALGKLPAEEIVAFDRFLQGQLRRANRWDLWGVAYIAMGGCGDDGFEYFRAWVVAHGREYFERAMRDPARAVDALEPGDSADCESLLYATAEAYETVTGKDLPPLPPELRGIHEPAGKPWKEENLGKLYPELAERFDFGD